MKFENLPTTGKVVFVSQTV